MKQQPRERAIILGEYILEQQATVRAAAEWFGISKSTVHKDVSERLPDLNPHLYAGVKMILEKNKQELLDAGVSVQGADLDEKVQKTVMDAINNALEANAEKGQELNSELSENMSDLESLKQNTQNSLESAKSEKAKIEHKKALLDKLGLGQHLERGISDLENNQKELGDINKELIDAQREISATSTKLDLL